MWLGDTPGVTPDPAVSDPNSIASWVAALSPLVTTGLQVWNQQTILDYNLNQIAAGKPPLTPDQMMALMSGSAPTLNVGLSGSTQTLVTEALIGVGLVVGAFLVVRMLSEPKSTRRAYA